MIEILFYLVLITLGFIAGFLVCSFFGVFSMATLADISAKLDTVITQVAALQSQVAAAPSQAAVDALNAKADALVAASAPVTPAA